MLYLKLIRLFKKTFLQELLILFLYIFIINNFLGNSTEIIRADGAGYYDYLKSIFYHKDFIRYNKPIISNPELYHRISNEPLTGSYIETNNYMVNKYPPGTALLIAPFFMYGYFTVIPENNFNDGYQKEFHKLVFYAALFYLFIALIYAKKLLRLFNIHEINIFIIQAAVIFTTSITHYAHAEASYSHIYSFFAITAFLYYCKKYFTTNKLNYLAGAAIFLGLIILIRNINVLIVFFTPFLAGTLNNYLSGLRNIFVKPKNICIVFICFSPFVFIQILAWYLQSGQWILYSYGKEGFDFTNPHFTDILFSYQKGLFIYHPVLLLSFIGLTPFFRQKRYFTISIWLLFFVMLTYILSSWWIWTYGCSFGQRVYVDFLMVFFIPIAVSLNEFTFSKYFLSALMLIFSYINVVQTYQYKEYILHWEQMDKEKYWKVFLKTHPKYAGLVWRDKNIPYQQLYTHTYHNEYNLTPYNTHILMDTLITDSILINTYNAILVGFYNPIVEDDNSKITLEIRQAGNKDLLYWHQVYITHFENEGFNKMQKASYLFKLQNIALNTPHQIILSIMTDEKNTVIKNLSIDYVKI